MTRTREAETTGARQARITDVIVLCYHALSPAWKAPLSVTPAAFERQLRRLADRGWRGTTFRSAALEAPVGRSVAVTFDDAFASVKRYAQPVLAELGWPATVFVPTRFAVRRQPLNWPGVAQWLNTPHAPELTCMDWNDLAELAADGWEVGSHTCSHPRLTQLDDDRLRDELEHSRHACLEYLGADAVSVAYPYGDVDERVADAAARAGYLAGASLSRNLRGSSPLRRPRVGVYNRDTDVRFALKVSSVTRRLRASRLWPDG